MLSRADMVRVTAGLDTAPHTLGSMVCGRQRPPAPQPGGVAPSWVRLGCSGGLGTGSPPAENPCGQTREGVAFGGSLGSIQSIV